MNEYVIFIMLSEILRIVLLTIPFLAFLFCYFFWRFNGSIRIHGFKSVMKKNISEEAVEQFELIYNQISNSDLSPVKNEKNKYILKYIINYILVIGIILIVVVLDNNLSFASIIILLFIAMICIIGAIYFIINRNSIKYETTLNQKSGIMYKQHVIKKLIHFINPYIQYEPKNTQNLRSDIYLKSGFKDLLLDPLRKNDFSDFIRSDLHIREYSDYMCLLLDNGNTVVMNDLLVYTPGRRRYRRKFFEGFIVEISRNYRNSERYRITGKQGVTSYNNISNKFEKYFCINSQSGNPSILTEEVKFKIAELYEKYKIMFEISAKENNIYIRFYTGKMFENGVFEPLLNKRKLYNEYVIFTNMLEIIKEINQIL